MVVRMQVVVKDGRVLIGDFLCIDKQGNLILGNTYQQVTRQVSLPFPTIKRSSGYATYDITQNLAENTSVTTSVLEPLYYIYTVDLLCVSNGVVSSLQRK